MSFMEPETPREKTQKNLFIAIAVVMVFVFVGGVVLGASGKLPFTARAESALPPDSADFGPLYQSWRLLEEHYKPATTTDALSSEEKVWGAISGLAEAYGDAYTVFLPPKEKETFESSVRGDFEGVGMEIGMRDDVLTVIAPLKDTPAYHAGIESGDKILFIDGESTAGITTEDAVDQIRGEKGSEVVLTVSRDGGAPFDIPVTRDTILLPTIDTELRDDGIFILSLYSFNALAPQYFRDAIREFAASGSDKLIIDLRGNPGGYLEVAVELASWFLPVGKTIVVEAYGDDAHDRVHRSRGYDVFTDQLKLAILINQGSASASEIFAGALNEHGEATLVGAQSFGKGSVQQVFTVTQDTSLKITVARWLTPNGNSISDGGLTPDIEVEYTEEDRDADRDPQLERAAELLLSGQ